MFYLSSSSSVLVHGCRLVQESQTDGLFVDVSSRISISKPDKLIGIEIPKVRTRVNADAAITRWTCQREVVSKQRRLLSDVSRFDDRRWVVATVDVDVVGAVATMFDVSVRRSLLKWFKHILLLFQSFVIMCFICDWFMCFLKSKTLILIDFMTIFLNANNSRIREHLFWNSERSSKETLLWNNQWILWINVLLNVLLEWMDFYPYEVVFIFVCQFCWWIHFGHNNWRNSWKLMHACDSK